MTRLTRHLSYTLSRQVGDTSSNFGESWGIGGIQDYTNMKEAAHTLSPWDQKHVVKGFVAYELPFGRGRSLLNNSGRLLNGLVGGWTLTGIVRYTSGKPLQFYSSNYYGWADWAATYTNLNLAGYHGSQFDASKYTPPTEANPAAAGNLYFPASVAVDPPYGQLGTGPARVSALRGFGSAKEDVSVMKTFSMGEDGRYRLSFRAEFYNIFNRHQFSDPETRLNSNAFGYVLGINSDPRQGQFGARFEW